VRQHRTVLTEDQVVEAVAVHLTAQGWVVKSRALATQHGDDLVLSRNGVRLVVEAKGEGSSKPGTKRYGQTFTSG
jgi:HJR/Mrr/RecB family endonuclease